ncbi:hypothetical protein [Variovorax sp. J31P207]|uniref:hypothetical protein n=1 Tax=Variovorax sp. J31P207 TaxID=3053510 RepID=UPI0025780424|nr:hypothetical protein [Variovorax sp. J31P207]MDM0069625.1 hypothetical protein [Variovorax sp. J31P207]
MRKSDDAKTRPSPQGAASKARPAETLRRQMGEATKLVEIRSGLFLNVDQIVTLRVLPQEDGDTYAILQLSNGDKLNLTRVEFALISGTEPRLPVQLPQGYRAT